MPLREGGGHNPERAAAAKAQKRAGIIAWLEEHHPDKSVGVVHAEAMKAALAAKSVLGFSLQVLKEEGWFFQYKEKLR